MTNTTRGLLLRPSIKSLLGTDQIDTGIKFIRHESIYSAPGSDDTAQLFVLIFNAPIKDNEDIANGYTAKCRLTQDGAAIILDLESCQSDPGQIKVRPLPQLRNRDKFLPVPLEDGIVSFD